MKRQTLEEFINKSKAIFGDSLDYSKVCYKNSRTIVVLTCKKHGDFLIQPNFHISYKRGCPVCSGFKHNRVSFVSKAISIHGNKYDYSKVDFCRVKSKVVIVCPIHGEFNQTPDKHINAKNGCPNCDKTVKKNTEYVKEKAKLVHGDKYDYSESVYVGMFKNIKITCPKHGAFWQAPSNHIRGKQGCPKCAYENSFYSQEDFIAKSTKKHNGEYDYSKVKYIRYDCKVEIICPKHGVFLQTPNSHMSGARCPKCFGSISKIEQEWLDDLLIPEEWRHKTIIHSDGHFRVDAYDAASNTVYEFYGDYWHGNPNIYNSNFINKHNKITFGELYSKTMERLNKLFSLGYKVVYIWEKDYRLKKAGKNIEHQKDDKS